MLFDTIRENVVQHIRNIYKEVELHEERTCNKLLQVQIEWNRSVERNYKLSVLQDYF